MSIAAPILWAAIVFILHVVPISSEKHSDIHIPHADKIVHFTMFLVLGFAILRAILLKYPEGNTRLNVLSTFVLSALYGAGLEYLQGILPSQRDSDIFDWFADIAGIFFGIIAALAFYRKAKIV